MLVVVSPAKSLDMSPVDLPATQPAFQEDAVRLSKTARNLTLKELKGLMDISDDLARLNRDRFKAFAAEPQADAVKPAAFAFNGDTYQGLEAKTLSEDDLAWAQDHLRILSGLYGLLRPLDAIQPYRLEMGSRLKTRRGKSLYDYWGDTIAKALNAQAEAVGTDTLITLDAGQDFHFTIATDSNEVNNTYTWYKDGGEVASQHHSTTGNTKRGKPSSPLYQHIKGAPVNVIRFIPTPKCIFISKSWSL